MPRGRGLLLLFLLFFPLWMRCSRALGHSSAPAPRSSVCTWMSPRALNVTLAHGLDTSAIRARPPEVLPPRTNNPSGRLMTGLLASSHRLQLFSQRPNVGQLHLGEGDFFIPRKNLVPPHENISLMFFIPKRKRKQTWLGCCVANAAHGWKK